MLDSMRIGVTTRPNGSRDVIGHVIIWFPIGRLLLMAILERILYL